jgi:hypothetical protein
MYTTCATKNLNFAFCLYVILPLYGFVGLILGFGMTLTTEFVIKIIPLKNYLIYEYNGIFSWHKIYIFLIHGKSLVQIWGRLQIKMEGVLYFDISFRLTR